MPAEAWMTPPGEVSGRRQDTSRLLTLDRIRDGATRVRSLRHVEATVARHWVQSIDSVRANLDAKRTQLVLRRKNTGDAVLSSPEALETAVNEARRLASGLKESTFVNGRPYVAIHPESIVLLEDPSKQNKEVGSARARVLTLAAEFDEGYGPEYVELVDLEEVSMPPSHLPEEVPDYPDMQPELMQDRAIEVVPPDRVEIPVDVLSLLHTRQDAVAFLKQIPIDLNEPAGRKILPQSIPNDCISFESIIPRVVLEDDPALSEGEITEVLFESDPPTLHVRYSAPDSEGIAHEGFFAIEKSKQKIEGETREVVSVVLFNPDGSRYAEHPLPTEDITDAHRVLFRIAKYWEQANIALQDFLLVPDQEGLDQVLSTSNESPASRDVVEAEGVLETVPAAIESVALPQEPEWLILGPKDGLPIQDGVPYLLLDEQRTIVEYVGLQYGLSRQEGTAALKSLLRISSDPMIEDKVTWTYQRDVETGVVLLHPMIDRITYRKRLVGRKKISSRETISNTRTFVLEPVHTANVTVDLGQELLAQDYLFDPIGRLDTDSLRSQIQNVLLDRLSRLSADAGAALSQGEVQQLFASEVAKQLSNIKQIKDIPPAELLKKLQEFLQISPLQFLQLNSSSSPPTEQINGKRLSAVQIAVQYLLESEDIVMDVLEIWTDQEEIRGVLSSLQKNIKKKEVHDVLSLLPQTEQQRQIKTMLGVPVGYLGLTEQVVRPDMSVISELQQSILDSLDVEGALDPDSLDSQSQIYDLRVSLQAAIGRLNELIAWIPSLTSADAHIRSSAEATYLSPNLDQYNYVSLVELLGIDQMLDVWEKKQLTSPNVLKQLRETLVSIKRRTFDQVGQIAQESSISLLDAAKIYRAVYVALEQRFSAALDGSSLRAVVAAKDEQVNTTKQTVLTAWRAPVTMYAGQQKQQGTLPPVQYPAKPYQQPITQWGTGTTPIQQSYWTPGAPVGIAPEQLAMAGMPNAYRSQNEQVRALEQKVEGLLDALQSGDLQWDDVSLDDKELILRVASRAS